MSSRFKVSFVIMIMILIILIQSLMNPVEFSNAISSSYSPRINLKHIIQIEEDGNLIVNNTIKLHNNTTDPISSFLIGFKKSFAANLDSLIAITTDGTELGITKNITLNNSNIYWMNISLYPTFVLQNAEYDFSVSFAFSGLFSILNSTTQVYGSLFPKYPSLVWNAESCEVVVKLPSGANFQNGSWSSLQHIESPLGAYSNEIGNVSFNGSINLVKGESAGREIVLDGFGNAIFYDSYIIRNVGLTSFSKMNFTIPKNSDVLSIFDSFGALTFTRYDGGTISIVNVAFRYPLRGKEDSNRLYDAYNLTINYKMKQTPISQNSWNNYQLKTKLFINPQWKIQTLIIRVVLPEGATFLTSSPINNALIMKGLTQTMVYNLQGVTTINNFDLMVQYQYVILWVALRPAIFVGIVVIAFSSIVIYRRRFKKSPRESISGENVKLVATFAEVYDEKMTLENEMRGLENDLDNGKIGKRDYNRRRSLIIEHLRLATRESSSLKEKIKQLGPQFAGLIIKIENSETEIRNLEAEINKNTARYRSRNLARDAYESLRDNNERKIEKIKVNIEGIIIELKGEAG
ncbi:MAG: hypothetical protein QG670_856 [Thermoproteota archaeon]|nr:hypothetical protein [Thermoproteota archaeon]